MSYVKLPFLVDIRISAADFNLTTLAPAHPLTVYPHYDNWVSAEEGLLPIGLQGSSLLDLASSSVAARLHPTASADGTVVVTLDRPGRHVAT